MRCGESERKNASAQPKKGFESTTTKTRKQLMYAAFTVSMRDESGGKLCLIAGYA